jgi:hypothetical protein
MLHARLSIDTTILFNTFYTSMHSNFLIAFCHIYSSSSFAETRAICKAIAKNYYFPFSTFSKRETYTQAFVTMSQEMQHSSLSHLYIFRYKLSLFAHNGLTKAIPCTLSHTNHLVKRIREIVLHNS